MYVLFCLFCFHRANWHSSATLRFFRAFSSVARQIPGYNLQIWGTARTLPNQSDHSGFESQKAFQPKLLTALFYVLFVCKCVLHYCHRTSTRMQFTNIYHVIYVKSHVGCSGSASQTITQPSALFKAAALVNQQDPSLSMLRHHTQTHHIQFDSSGRGIVPTQRPLPDNTQHSQQTDVHVSGGIRTRNSSTRAAADPRLGTHGHRDRLETQLSKTNN